MEYVAAALLGFAGGHARRPAWASAAGSSSSPRSSIFLDQTQVSAEATSLLAIVFVAALGAWRQHGYGNVRVRDGLVIGGHRRRSAWPAASRSPTRSPSARSSCCSPRSAS